MFDARRSPRQDDFSPITFRLKGREAEGTLVNLSGTGALLRFASALPFGPECVGEQVVFVAWYDVGALLKSPATAVRYIEESESKLLAVRYLPE
jgi:c-di-GMP-binding flagellar brake protein YcgR